MPVPSGIEKRLLRMVDMVFEMWPQPVPAEGRLDRCKIVAHRGGHDNLNVYENTLDAFDAARRAGVWGIEFDIRWTRDRLPVVFHDRDLRRIFGSRQEIGGMTRKELRRTFPQIPFLEEVVERYGGDMHLMVEIKSQAGVEPSVAARRLSDVFEGLSPETDYHFLSLDPGLFRWVDFVAPTACLPVAQLNLRQMSRSAIENGYKGVAGHYLLVTRRVMVRHKTRGQMIGTGYIRSKNSLFRELGRGVDWIFSNDAQKLQHILDAFK